MARFSWFQNLNCCYAFPYGWFTILPFFCCLAATALATTAAFTCNLFSVNFGGTVGEVTFGVWSVSDVQCIAVPDPTSGEPQICLTSKSCVSYENSLLGDNALDNPLIFARLVSIVSLIFGVVMLITIGLFCCIRMFTCVIIFLSVGTMVTGIINIFMLAGLASGWCVNQTDAKVREECEAGYSTALCVVASVIWMIGTCGMCCLNPRVRRLTVGPQHKDEDEEDKPDEEEDKKEEEKEEEVAEDEGDVQEEEEKDEEEEEVKEEGEEVQKEDEDDTGGEAQGDNGEEAQGGNEEEAHDPEKKTWKERLHLGKH